MSGIVEQRFMVHRQLVEPGTLWIKNMPHPLFPADQSLHLLNILAVPEIGWTAHGDPATFKLWIGEMPRWESPVEVMKAEWRRYELGVQDFNFKRIAVPVRQYTGLELTGKKAVLLDFFIVHARDAC